jgi:hypothetical protein
MKTVGQVDILGTFRRNLLPSLHSGKASEKLVTVYQNVQSHVPEDINFIQNVR